MLNSYIFSLVLFNCPASFMGARAPRLDGGVVEVGALVPVVGEERELLSVQHIALFFDPCMTRTAH